MNVAPPIKMALRRASLEPVRQSCTEASTTKMRKSSDVKVATHCQSAGTASPSTVTVSPRKTICSMLWMCLKMKFGSTANPTSMIARRNPTMSHISQSLPTPKYSRMKTTVAVTRMKMGTWLQRTHSPQISGVVACIIPISTTTEPMMANAMQANARLARAWRSMTQTIP